MRGLLLVSLLLLACVAVVPTVSPGLSPSPPAASASPRPTVLPSVTATPSDLYLTIDDVFLHPGPDLYGGDVVTFDVTPRNLGRIDPSDLAVHVYRRTSAGADLVGAGVVEHPTLDEVPRARLTWAWDTAGLSGTETLVVALDPDDRLWAGDEDPTNNVVTLTVRLLPLTTRPDPEASATWVTTTTDCCLFHYLTGTAAERDLPTIVAAAEDGVAHARARLGGTAFERLDVHLVSRVIGHGGYAQSTLALSYLDRQYAGGDLETVVRHEATHVLERGLSPAIARAPTLLREGLATWVAGGHFKPEPLLQRAAALVELGWFIPLRQLEEDFYQQQHESAYVESASLVAYLVETYGWERFWGFYVSFDGLDDAGAATLDRALLEAFGQGLAETEAALLRWLQDHPPAPEQVRDLRITVALFETIRRYQQLYDPGAYFLTGWLPDPAEAQRRGISADFLRHPRAAENVTLETMLIAAQEALEAGRFDRSEDLLDAVRWALEEGSLSRSPAADYLAVVQAMAAEEHEVQRIEMEGTTARVWVVTDWPVVIERALQRGSLGWVLCD